MKATKVSRKIEILSTFFRLGLIITFLASCDVLESDPDVLEPAVEITDDEVYVLSNGTSFIDLQSRVQSNLEARLAVTTSPSHGTLTDLGKGIIQYAPTAGNTRVKDGFEVTVFSKTNEILKKDTVVIIVEHDSTKLPCSIYPVNDYVYNVTSAVTTDVTANDIICSGDVFVSVYRPENTFPPYYGTATVIGSKIVYTPGASFQGEDKLMYKLTASNDPSVFAYGMVYLSNDSSCNFALTDDLFIYSAKESTAIKIPVFANDTICHPRNLYQVRLKTNAKKGKATMVSDGIYYEASSPVMENFDDWFTYEVCVDGNCKSAQVDVGVRVDSSGCPIKAVRDSIVIANNISVVHLNVLDNDSTCGLTTFEIVKAPLHGTATVNANLKFIEYKPDPLTASDDWLDYKICDTDGCSTATVNVIRKK
ncbi:MAG TPA: Ig-like domain-containing protein [Chryseolinea sp.]